MITREQAAKLKMGDRLVAYRNTHVRIGEATPVEFEPCLVLCVQNNPFEAMADAVASACGSKENGEPRIVVAYNDGTTQMLRGGCLFVGMTYAHDAVEADIADIGRMTTAIMAAWHAYFEEAGPRHVNCPCTVKPLEDTSKAIEASVLEHVYQMATQSLAPEAFEKFEDVLDKLVKARHLNGIGIYKPR